MVLSGALAEMKTRKGLSKFPGVHYHPPTKKWRAQFCFQGGKYHVGCFATPEAGAKAREIRKKQFVERLKKGNGLEE
jgi:hypothetical protein